jgi:hypothetical protein
MKVKTLWEKLWNWELWPFALRYVFISPVWLWYCMRAGSPWFFTPSNPTISFGGFEGEGKKEMYELLPPSSFPRTIFIEPGISFQSVKQKITDAGFTYPFIVKPDVGMKGLLFRKLNDESKLQLYHSMVPCEYIVQDLVTYPLEVSVFYYRHPKNLKGVITGFIQKDLMEVTGNGVHTIHELVMRHPKAKFRMEEIKTRHEEQFHIVPAMGEKYQLAHAANLNRGASFTNLEKEIDDDLVKIFDAISIPAQFFYGRFDIKCNSVEDLKKGINFSILEYNGSGAEPNHVYQSGMSLLQANKVFLKHWKVLFEISTYNHKKGIPYWSFKKGLQFLSQARKHFALLEAYEKKILI